MAVAAGWNMRSSWLYQTSTGASAVKAPTSRPLASTVELGYKTQDSPDHENPYEGAEDAQGSVALASAEPAEERLPVVEGEIVGGGVFVSDQLEGARHRM